MDPASIKDETKRAPKWIGVLLLLGAFAGLCALLSAAVTVGEAWQERAQARWPATTATIQRCHMNAVGTDEPGYIIACEISYRMDGAAVQSTIESMSVHAPELALWDFPPGHTQALFDSMQRWVDNHPRGTPIVVHVDPANRAKAVLVATDMPMGGPHTPSNIKVAVVFAGICVLLLAAGILARRRRADTP